MTLINSAANENIKRWRKISEHPRGAKKIGTTLAEGIHLAEVICEKRPETRAVVVRENNVHPDVHALAERVAEETGAKFLTVADKLYDVVCPVENGTGIMVEVAVEFAQRPMQPIAEDALYLDGVQDAGNMGTLIRTALAAGVRHIAASSGSAGFWAPKVLELTSAPNSTTMSVPKKFTRFSLDACWQQTPEAEWTCSARRAGKRDPWCG